MRANGTKSRFDTAIDQGAVRPMLDYSEELIGEHESIHTLRALIKRIAQSPARTILIYGETGTGKGLVSRIIHQMSARAKKEFVDINCAAIPSDLLESELFGHEKGAFTGADVRKTGLVEAADGGSIFLDEIREMEPTLQAKLLSFLDSRQFRRVGAVRPTSVDVRLIAATNKILLREVSEGNFREDLYYRLQAVAVNIPPLRERGTDVLHLAERFITKFNRQYQSHINGITTEAKDIMLSYPWPGNVRELGNLIEKICIIEDDEQISPDHMPDRILRTVRAGSRTVVSPASEPTADMPTSEGFHEATDEFQRRLIRRALLETGHSVQKAAERLRISRHALRHQMKKLGIPSA